MLNERNGAETPSQYAQLFSVLVFVFFKMKFCLLLVSFHSIQSLLGYQKSQNMSTRLFVP